MGAETKKSLEELSVNNLEKEKEVQLRTLKRGGALENITALDYLSEKYNVTKEDVLLIALNASAMTSDKEHSRVRFKFSLLTQPQTIFYFGIPVLKTNTPFHLSFEEKTLSLNGSVIGNVFDPENDTCDTSYFRRNGTALTLNTNARSNCTGCAICATHRQDANDKTPINTEDRLSNYMRGLYSVPKGLGIGNASSHDLSKSARTLDFSDLHQVTIVTGCFPSEEKATSHLKMVHRYFADRGFRGEFRFIGSEIRSRKALEELSNETDNMVLCLSFEFLTRREKLLRDSKASLTLENAIEVLSAAKDVGIKGSFTYVVGMDSLEDMRDGLRRMSPFVGDFPIFQVFQPHWKGQLMIRQPEAATLEYYLDARKEIETIFEGTGLKPKPWQNYRSLWYFTFDNKPLEGIRI